MPLRSKSCLWLPATLAAGVAVASVGGSACFTSSVLNSAKSTVTQVQTPALRVEHTYYDSRGRLLVLAEGGPWQSDAAATPHNPVWFVLDLRHTGATPGGGTSNAQVITFPQSVIKQGAPDLSKLAADGFREIPFSEFRNNLRQPMPGAAAPTQPSAQVVYMNGLRVTPNFPEQIGYDPRFSVNEGEPGALATGEIADVTTESHPAKLLLLPVAVAADAVTTPFLLVIVLGGGLK